MYDESSSVNSYLVDSFAWNTICNKFNTILSETKYENLKCLNALHTYENSKWTVATTYKTTVGSSGVQKREGNKGIELATGASDDFKVYNIYDMAGNMWEWTTEHGINSENMYVVARGR